VEPLTEKLTGMPVEGLVCSTGATVVVFLMEMPRVEGFRMDFVTGQGVEVMEGSTEELSASPFNTLLSGVNILEAILAKGVRDDEAGTRDKFSP
jgi:hypothetical protein